MDVYPGLAIIFVCDGYCSLTAVSLLRKCSQSGLTAVSEQ